MSFFTGYRVSPTDILDIRYALVAPRLDFDVPDEYDTETTPLPIYEQGNIPSCAGWTGAGIKTAHEFIECERVIRFDGLDLYGQVALPCDHGIAYKRACPSCGGVSLGGGSYMRSIFQAMQKTGVLAEDGQRYRIGGYAAIDPKNHAEVKHSMVTTGQLAIGFSVPRSFMAGGGAEFNIGEGAADDIVGGHAIRVRGYTPEKVIWPNTWGKTWDVDGVAEVSWDFWDTYVTECWTILDVGNEEIAENLAKRRDLLNLFGDRR
jgi:hypothetical protein